MALTMLQSSAPFLAGFFERRQRIDGFAALGDGEHGAALVDNRIAIAVFAAVIDFDVQARQLLDVEFTDESAVVTGAAGDGDNPLKRCWPARRSG